mgnify:FL=1
MYIVDPDGAGPAAAFSFGDPNFSRDQSALWRDPADNVFLGKMNYWLGR